MFILIKSYSFKSFISFISFILFIYSEDLFKQLWISFFSYLIGRHRSSTKQPFSFYFIFWPTILWYDHFCILHFLYSSPLFSTRLWRCINFTLKRVIKARRAKVVLVFGCNIKEQSTVEVTIFQKFTSLYRFGSPHLKRDLIFRKTNFNY